MHNASSYHALPALVSGLHQTVGALSSNKTGPTFTVKSHPLPLSSEESVQLDSLLMVRILILLIVFAGACVSFPTALAMRRLFGHRTFQHAEL